MATFTLTLQDAYYNQGFFNVPVDYDRHVRQSEGQIDLVLGQGGPRISGSINRRANQNGTARIMGGTELRDWFQQNFSKMDSVEVLLDSTEQITFLMD
jgi:hypothetical protein